VELEPEQQALPAHLLDQPREAAVRLSYTGRQTNTADTHTKSQSARRH
jgi:hypothetical protein